MLAVSAFGAFGKSAARKLADEKQRPVLCRPSRGTVREIQPGGKWSQVEFVGNDIFDDMGIKLAIAGKSLIFHYAGIESVRNFALGKF